MNASTTAIGLASKVRIILVSSQYRVAPIPVEMFDRITQAKKTEIKLVTTRGKYSFKLNDFQKKSVTALLNTIK